MRNLYTKFWSKIILGILILSFILIPFGINTSGAVATNTAHAQLLEIYALKKTLTGGSDLGCDITKIFTNCVVEGLYFVIFKPLAEITVLAAKFLDFFVYYSISSSAYNNGFVEKAWSVVRDVSNMFFILVLLYVGIKTILGMHTSDNKRILSTIVLIALLMNFSLFTAKVVIDASNILARVFYTNITPYNSNGQSISPDEKQPKSISVGLVRNFDPQKVIADPAEDIGSFALVMIIFIGLLLYMVWMFISVSMLFVGRVAGLWIAMIFSPLAFISYTLPFSIPSFGHKKWWSDLFQLSFMAPIFAFFLYVIILFGGFLEEVQYDVANATNWLDKLMKAVIPFVLIFILLSRARKITKEYAGEAGEAFSKAGAVVGGLALGAVTGGTAMLARGTLGAYGSKLMNSETLKDTASKGGVSGWFARKQLDLGKAMATGSFDARGIKIANKSLADTGLQKLGQAKSGGYVKMKEEQAKRDQKRAAELAVSHGSKMYHDVEEAELKNQELLRKEVLDAEGKSMGSVIDILGKIDDHIKEKKEEVNEINSKLSNMKDGPERDGLLDELNKARAEWNEAKAERKAVRDSSVFVNNKGEVKDYSSVTTSGKINSKGVEKINEEVAKAQEAVEKAKKQQVDMNNQLSASSVAVDQAIAELKKAEEAEQMARNTRWSSPGPENEANLKKAEETVLAARRSVQKAEENKKEIEKNVSNNASASITEAEERLKKIKQAQEKISSRAENLGVTQEHESIGNYEGNIIPKLKKKIDKTTKQRLWNVAENLEKKSTLGHVNSWLWNMGDYSAEAKHEAAYKIKMGVKIEDSGHGGDHGGGHGGGGHSAPPKPKPAPKPAPKKDDHGHDDHGHGGGHH